MTLPADVILLFLIVIFFLGGTVRGVLGFGLPLTTTAMLPLVIPVEMALTVNAMVLSFTNIAQLLHGGRIRETMSRFRTVLAGIVVGVPIGAAFITLVDDHVLMFALGAFIILFIVINILNPHFTVPVGREREIGAAAGMRAGHFAGHRIPTREFHILVMAILCLLVINLMIQVAMAF